MVTDPSKFDTNEVFVERAPVIERTVTFTVDELRAIDTLIGNASGGRRTPDSARPAQSARLKVIAAYSSVPAALR